MRIISKYKDYYDYLSGIWGIDEKLVLDRTEYHTIPYSPAEYTLIRFFICDFQIEGMYINGRYLFGEELEPYISTKYKYMKGDDVYYIHNPITSIWSYIRVLKKPLKLKSSPNIQLDCPILLSAGEKDKKYEKFPILKEYSFHRVYPAEEIYLMIIEWLGKRKDIQAPDNQTDKEKIVSHGFDTKTSFRKL